MTSKQFKEILNKIPGVTAYHNKASKAVNNYIVWAEVGKNRMTAEGRTAESVGIFAVDLFTKDEYSETPAEIEKILEDNNVLITDYVVIFEEETGLTHYAYTVEG